MTAKFFHCACYGEGVKIDYDPEDDSYYLSIWQMGYREPVDWTHRMRHIWRIIRTGRPWADQVVLSTAEAMALSDGLRQHTGKDT